MTILDFEKPLFALEKRLEELVKKCTLETIDLDPEIRSFNEKIAAMRLSLVSSLSPEDRLLLVRHPDRPRARSYIRDAFSSFIEIRGDRIEADDPDIVCGFATIEGIRCAVIAQEKPSNFSPVRAEGFRKAQRMIHLAEKFHIPLVSLVDTSAEGNEIETEAAAACVRTLSARSIPAVAVIIGETGGSLAALAFSVAERVLILENACAPGSPFLTSREMLTRGLVHAIIPEPPGGAHRDLSAAADAFREGVSVTLAELKDGQ